MLKKIIPYSRKKALLAKHVVFTYYLAAHLEKKW